MDAVGTLGAVAPYYGAKRTLAPKILDLMLSRLGTSPAIALRKVEQYITCFHGSLPDVIELRGRGYTGSVIANDAYGYISNLAQVIADARLAAALHNALVCLPFHEATHAEACRSLQLWEIDVAEAAAREQGEDAELFGRLHDERRVQLAAWCMVAWWMGRNGEVAGTGADWEKVAGQIARRFTMTGGDPAVRWQQAVASVPLWWKALMGRSQFLCQRVERWLGSVRGGPGVLVYMDPPYLGAPGERYAQKARPVQTPQGPIDFHAWLAGEAARLARAGSVVGVSYYRDDRLGELYSASQFEHIDLAVAKFSRNAGEGAAAKAPEVLLLSRPATPSLCHSVAPSLPRGGGVRP